LDEKNIIHKDVIVSDFESKGFLPASRVQDFPISGKALYLVFRRRRWRHKITKKEASIKKSFPKANIVTDRFHVIKLVIDALQYCSITLSNGDSYKQLLARSRHLLAKDSKKWTENQQQRAELLFREFPELKSMYYHVMNFRNIYENKSKEKAKKQFIQWIEKTKKLKMEEFNSTAKSINYNLENILNFFDNRSTNASAESFNAKIKLFRANLRGVADTKFFLFRLKNLFA